MTLNTRSSKAKGRRLQTWVVAELLTLFHDLTCDDIRSTGMGQAGEDVQLSQKARNEIKASFECKNVERVNIWSAYKQAQANCATNARAIVVVKKNKHKPLAIMDAQELFKLLRKREGNT